MIKLNKTGFTDNFIKINSLPEDGFKEWLLYPGMLFNSSDKWWADGGTRNAPHEGIDLCAYTDRHENIHNIAEGMKVPVLYEGIVASVIDDFIARSMIVKHSTRDNKEFCTIYGHTVPEYDIRIGKAVKAGDVIARVAGLKESGSGMRPHLHISIGFPSSIEISYDDIDWKDISDPNKITLIDPLGVIDRYRLV